MRFAASGHEEAAAGPQRGPESAAFDATRSSCRVVLCLGLKACSVSPFRFLSLVPLGNGPQIADHSAVDFSPRTPACGHYRSIVQQQVPVLEFFHSSPPLTQHSIHRTSIGYSDTARSYERFRYRRQQDADCLLVGSHSECDNVVTIRQYSRRRSSETLI